MCPVVTFVHHGLPSHMRAAAWLALAPGSAPILPCGPESLSGGASCAGNTMRNARRPHSPPGPALPKPGQTLNSIIFVIEAPRQLIACLVDTALLDLLIFQRRSMTGSIRY
jgi:hypothetical protein